MSTTARITVERIAPSIAAEMGDGWSAAASTQHYDNPWQVWYLRHTDGTALRLRLADHTRGRLVISGELPTIPEGVEVNADGLARGNASADPTRPARSIAGQIRRTVLPELRESMAKLRQRIEAARDLEAQQQAVHQQLRTVPGFELGLYWQGEPRGTYQYATNPQASVSIHGDRDGAYVEIALRGLTADQAERVLRALTA